MKAKIIVINGYPGAGKDTFCQLCSTLNKEIYPLHTSSPAKNALDALGWKGQKTPEIRNLLAEIMLKSNTLFDTGFMYVLQQVRRIEKIYENAEHPPIIFVHSREPHNIQRFVEKFGAKTLLITKDLNWETDKPINDSDALVQLYDYDNEIDNNGSIEELTLAAAQYLEEVIVPWQN